MRKERRSLWSRLARRFDPTGRSRGEARNAIKERNGSAESMQKELTDLERTLIDVRGFRH